MWQMPFLTLVSPLNVTQDATKVITFLLKKVSMLTQKDLTKVEEQTAERMLKREVLALAQMV